ncbi:conserved hypothetical protein [Trichinella spiralis]|uniref:hypothetical protein n=1 Tax=Trichinella spiralis TaxID=6334 RepID=UPI0001EFE903|nr:conserved hypothetical protein [Trichinella spiralis]
MEMQNHIEEECIDFVLLYQFCSCDESELNSLQEEKREIFEKNLQDEGLKLTYTTEEAPDGTSLNFVHIHAPWEVLCKQAEMLKLRMPIKVPFETIDALFMRKICIIYENDLDKPMEKSDLWQRVKNWILFSDGEHRHYFTTKFRRDLVDKFNIPNRETFFTTAQRSRMVWDILVRTGYGSVNRYKRGIDHLIRQGVYLDAFPLHEGSSKSYSKQSMTDRQYLYRYWARMSKWWRPQPYETLLWRENSVVLCLVGILYVCPDTGRNFRHLLRCLRLYILEHPHTEQLQFLFAHMTLRFSLPLRYIIHFFS